MAPMSKVNPRLQIKMARPSMWLNNIINHHTPKKNKRMFPKNMSNVTKMVLQALLPSLVGTGSKYIYILYTLTVITMITTITIVITIYIYIYIYNHNNDDNNNNNDNNNDRSRLRNNHSNQLGGGTPTPCWSNSACCRFEGLNSVTANPEIPKSQVAWNLEKMLANVG
jgi:hypothetical protein